MRILHTSDWHLGQHFMGKTRLAEHQAFLAWLIAQIGEHAVDAVIVAGDIFDTGTPPSYARELYNSFVSQMHDSGATLVVLGGNHDSVATLGESRSVLRKLGTHVVPGVTSHLDDQVLVLNDRQGRPGAVLCAIPFIRARDVMVSEAGQSAEDKQRTLQDAIHQHYQALHAQALARREALGLALPVIATGHLTTVGASASESVREIYVGALEAFPSNAFPAADYIALGHIHRAQKVGGLEHIRYSGSPIPLSFDEAAQSKEVLLVTLGEAGLQAVMPLTIPRFQGMATVSGSLAELPERLAEVAAQGQAEHPAWVEVVVQADDYLNDLQPRLQAMIDGLPIEILRIRRTRVTANAALQRVARETLDELSPEEVFLQRLAGETLEDGLRTSLQARYRDVLSELQEEQA